MSALDIERRDDLVGYLESHGYLDPAERESLVCETLSGGVSNRAVLVRFADGRAWVVKQALEKLRVPVDWFSSPNRVHREASGLRWIRGVADRETVGFVFEDLEEHLLAMEAVPKPHENWKTLLLSGSVDLELVGQFGSLLATIHRESHLDRIATEREFENREFFESLRLEPYYAYAAEQTPEAANFLTALIRFTRERRECVVHGDYSPKNVLIRNGRIILLDHEVIHFGDPSFDVGFGSTHFLAKSHHVEGRRDEFTRAAQSFYDAYAAGVTGCPWSGDLDSRAVDHTLACLLARVRGRSPLEYLSEEARQVQRQAVLELIGKRPLSFAELIAGFSALT